jgi:hypothetical protein
VGLLVEMVVARSQVARVEFTTSMLPRKQRLGAESSREGERVVERRMLVASELSPWRNTLLAKKEQMNNVRNVAPPRTRLVCPPPVEF